MTYKAEYKSLNNLGQQALRYWDENKDNQAIVGMVSHQQFKARNIINRFLKENMYDAVVYAGTNPKNNTNSLYVYDNTNQDHQFKGYVDVYPFTHDLLIQTLEHLGCNCHK